MSDWEQYRDVLSRLYLVQRKNVKKIKKHMENKYNFNREEGQYQAQFRKWKFSRKNMRKSDWEYISWKLEQRGQRKSVVFRDGVQISLKKVQKSTSRMVHPNDRFNRVTYPPSPGNIIVRSLSPDFIFQYSSPHESIHIERHMSNSIVGPSSSRTQQLIDANDLTSQSTHSIVPPDSQMWRNAFCVLQSVDLSGLPYFQLRDMLNSEDAKKWFQDILVMEDPLLGNVVHNFGPESTSPIPSQLPSNSHYADISMDRDMDSDWNIFFYQPLPKVKPFGLSLLQDISLDHNDLIWEQRKTLELTSILANVPFKNDKEAQVLNKVLFGPPTIEAARRFIEIGVYIVSNNLDLWLARQFIETMLLSIDWPVLRPILSLQAPSIQAFTESVFLHAIVTKNLRIVTDLLHLESIKATVVYNGSALVSAVQTSSCELVSLILDAGAQPNKCGKPSRLPLTETRDVQVARLLVNAGADINSLEGLYRYDLYPATYGPAVVAATARRNIDLVRYLIEVGADVNMCAERSTSVLMVAVHVGTIEILRMLLRAGAKVNDASCMFDGFEQLGPRMTPLQKAVEMCDIEAVRLLVEYGGNVNAPAYGKPGKTALQTAVSQGDIEMTKFLLRNGADVNTPGKNDATFPCSVLTTAVEMNHLDLVGMILDAGADINISSFGFFGRTALESAMCGPHGSDVRDLLVARGAQHNVQPNDEYRQIQLRKAVSTNNIDRVKVLLGTGLEIDMSPFEVPSQSIFLDTPEQRSILQDAVQSGTAVFQLLFDIIKTYDEEIDFHPILVEAILARNMEIQTTVLEAGANINSTNCRAGKLVGTPLMFAVLINDLETVQFLYKKGADINIVVEKFDLDLIDNKASTALQISLRAARYGRNHSFDIFHFLRYHGAAINAPIPREHGLSELALAVMTQDLSIVQGLLNSGANINSLPAEDEGSTALQAAASLDPANIDMVQLLLKNGADVNAPPACHDGKTALGAAAERGSYQIALILLKAGANINATFEQFGQQTTALKEAAYYGRLDIVHLLLRAGADLHLPQNMRYIEATNVARKVGHIAIATMLENWKADKELLGILTPMQSLSLGFGTTSSWDGDRHNTGQAPMLGNHF